MEKSRTSKIIAVVALVVAVLGLSLGFAAFSNTLTISSSATVSPDSGDFDINRIKTKEIRINTVSGDVDISYIEADKAIFDTISGDIDVCGKLKLK